MDCLFCNQAQYHIDYHIRELRIGELCARFLRNPNDTSGLGVYGGQNTSVVSSGQGAGATSVVSGDKNGSPTPTVAAAQAS